MSLAPCDSRVNSASRWNKAALACLEPAMRYLRELTLNYSCANRLAAAPQSFAPQSKANELRPLPPWPQTEIRSHSHKFGHRDRNSTQLPQTRCCNPGQRTAGPLPMSDLGRCPCNQKVQGRTYRDMLQGRCQPNPPLSNNIGRMVATHGRHAVKTMVCNASACAGPVRAPGSCWLRGEGTGRPSHSGERAPFRTRHMPVLPGGGHLRAMVCPTRGACVLWLRLYPEACRPNPLDNGNCSCPNRPTSC